MATFIEEQLQQYPQEEEELKPKKVSTFRKLISDRRVRLFALFLVFAVTVPILVFYFSVDQRDYEKDESYTCAIAETYRVSCGPVNISRAECLEIKCCYDFTPEEGCYHSIPARYMYTNFSGLDSYNATQLETPFLNESIQGLKFSLNPASADKLQIIVQTSTSPTHQSSSFENRNYKVKTHKNLLGVEVSRSESQELILTTLRGPLIASDGYWEWTFQLICEKLYGLGEVLLPNTTITKVIYKNRNDHSTLPSFMALLNGSFHGVLVEHDGPLEVTVLPSRLVLLRSLAENRMVLNLVTGPTPRDVAKQLRAPYEMKPVPYWALGAHICRDGKTTINSALEEFKGFVAGESRIQFDSDCIHENLYAMLHEKVGAEVSLKNMIGALQEKSHFLMSVPPQILKENLLLYDSASELNVLYRGDMGETLSGYYLGQEVVYPDFAHDSINIWMELLKANLPAAQVDGFILRDNWPEEESYAFSNDGYKFPYLPEMLQSSLSRSIPLNAVNTKNEPHILLHNKYGKTQVDAFNSHMKDPTKYEFLATSSYDHSVQDAVHVQNVNITWTNLKKVLTWTLFHSILGNPVISVPVCGSTNYYNEERDEELCIRWYTLAASMPLLRVSSDWPRRDPSSLATDFASQTAIRAIERRFRLLPYYYTVVNLGEPLVRPMLYDFHSDNETLELDEQYMLGDALLVAQPLLPKVMYVWVYLPPRVGVWYEFWGGMGYRNGGWTKIHITEADWVMFLAEGRIIPMRHNKRSKIISTSPEDMLRLTVALKCSSESCISEGSMKLTSSTLMFHSDKNGLTISNISEAKGDICGVEKRIWPHVIEKITIYGLEKVKFDFPGVDLCTAENEIYIEYSK